MAEREFLPPMQSNTGAIAADGGVQKQENRRQKKSPSVFGYPENIFEPMFTGACYVFGISYPEKIGVSVLKYASLAFFPVV